MKTFLKIVFYIICYCIGAYGVYKGYAPPAFFWLPTIAIIFFILAQIGKLFPFKIRIAFLSGLKWVDDHTLNLYTKKISPQKKQKMIKEAINGNNLLTGLWIFIISAQLFFIKEIGVLIFFYIGLFNLWFGHSENKKYKKILRNLPSE